jgi:hypothetical protein
MLDAGVAGQDIDRRKFQDRKNIFGINHADLVIKRKFIKNIILA